MKIAIITAGTGSYHCGMCMRDNALAVELRRQGHDTILIPMYLPMQLDEVAANPEVPIFFGGVSTFLKEKIPLLRRMPRWVDRMLSAPRFLRQVAGRAAKTGGPDVAELTLSMLRGEKGNQGAEIELLLDWLERAFDGEKPDVVWLSTALFAGLTVSIRKRLRVPVLGFLQGEDSFLDGLGPEYSPRVWALLGERMADADLWIAPSVYFKRRMARGLGWDGKTADERIDVVLNGISVEGFERFSSQRDERNSVRPATIGYFARMIPAKGLGLLVEAFLLLKKKNSIAQLQLRCAGSITRFDERYVQKLKDRIEAAGFSADVRWFPNVSREKKIEFLGAIDVFSVPAIYSEAFGLYVLEAMAAGVPVVQPNASAFPEIVQATGGGVLFELGETEGQSAEQLAAALEGLLLDLPEARKAGKAGRESVERNFTIRRLGVDCVQLSKISAGDYQKPPGT